MSVWISDEKLLFFASLISPSNDFVLEKISNIRHGVSSGVLKLINNSLRKYKGN